MLSRTAFHRRFVPAVLASYLLAATATGLFHHHGDGCCEGPLCAVDTAAQPARANTCRHKHAKCAHHAHRHAANPADAPRTDGSPRPEQPGSPRPFSNDGCAVCRFLAQKSVAPTLVTFEVWSQLTTFEPPAKAICIANPLAAEHPARGPPQQS
ncbi:MAG: hypothetical protein ACT4QC_20710 [Planctomycetaceae bacterium]